MTDTEKKFKDAFMALLANYQHDIGEVTEHQQTFCDYSCPLGKSFTDSCKRIFGEDADPTNEQCAEAIADFYAADWNCGKDY